MNYYLLIKSEYYFQKAKSAFVTELPTLIGNVEAFIAKQVTTFILF